MKHKISDMSRTKAELIERCEELGIDTEPLTNNDLREEAIEAKEAEAEITEDTKEESPEATPEPSEATSEEEKASDHYEDDRGRKWAFKKSAPKTLNIDGHPMSQKEILETEEVVSELVYGNCSHLTQTHD